MANHLKMAMVQAIQALRERGWSFPRLGRELGLHRETVARYVRLVKTQRADPPSGPDGQNRPNLPAGSSGPTSRCAAFRGIIIAGLQHAV